MNLNQMTCFIHNMKYSLEKRKKQKYLIDSVMY